MKFKEGVKVFGLRPEMMLVFNAIDCFDRELTITSICDGKHGEASRHYNGFAVDVRTRDDNSSVQWSIEQKKNVARFIKDRLTADFDVVVEADHIHIEFDRRGEQ